MDNKALLKGLARFSIIVLTIFLFAFFTVNFIMRISATEETQIWTTDLNGTPRSDFSPDETVYIHGSNFLANNNVDISITRPDATLENYAVTSDEFGGFVYGYVLNGIFGVYNVTASDGVNTAETNFTDSPGAIWTTRDDCGNMTQDVNHFAIGDHVFINGEGFLAGPTGWYIKGKPGDASCDPSTVVASGFVNINETGAFCFDAYTVQPDDCGEYQVKVGYKGDNYQVEGITTTTTTTTTTTSTTSTTTSSTTSTTTTTSSTTTTTIPCPPDIEIDKFADPTSLLICQDTTVTLNVTGVGCPFEEHFPIDLMFVMDRSGSMDDDCPGGDADPGETPCKINDAKTAAKAFVDLMNPSTDRSGLSSYNESATLDQSLTPDQTSVKNAIDAMQARGWTAIGSGLDIANNELINNGRSNAVWVEILLTNGLENQGSDPIGMANDAAAAGIIIYTIGLGSDVNEDLLKEIANVTGGKYYFAPNGTVLQQIYQEISEEVLNIAGIDVVVTDVIPPYANYIPGSLSVSPPDTCLYDDPTRTITCDLGTVLIRDTYLITFDLTFDQTGHLLTNVYPDSEVTWTDYQGISQSEPFPETYVDVSGCDDGVGCTVDTCDEELGCINTPDDSICDDDLWCNGDEYCDAVLDCQPGTPPDCDYYTEFCDGDIRMSEIGFCNEDIDSCDYTTDEIFDCSANNYEECQDTYYEHFYTESCYEDQGSTECLPASSLIDCRDDLWCDGQEYCSEEGGVHCEDDVPVDCSGNDIPGISTCYYDPDLLDETFDWRDPFTSQCVEDGGNTGYCTTGDDTINHDCADADNTDGVFNYNSVTQVCEAECDGAGTECENKCVGEVWYYSGSCNLGDCYCDYQTEDCNQYDGCYDYDSGCEDRDYGCGEEGCDYSYSNRNTDYNDSYEQYCSDSEIREHRLFHDFYCDSSCIDHESWVDDRLVENCDDRDDWYDTAETRWVGHPTDPCMEIEQKKQKYRDFGCVENLEVDCDWTETDERWVDTGKERVKEDVIGPDTHDLAIEKTCNKIDITATVEDVCSIIEEAEYFFDECPDENTRGTPLSATDGTFDEILEDVYKNGVDVSGLTDGRHNLYVRGKDAEGNWGECASVGFDVDVNPPHRVERNISTTMACGDDVTITALICEPYGFNESFICDAEYYLDDFNLPNGGGVPMQPIDGEWGGDFCELVTATIDVSQLSEGTHYVKMHGMDCTCNWGKLTLPPLWFIKDTTPPTSTKTVGEPKLVCEYTNDGERDVEECWYVTQDTNITLDAQDHDPGDGEFSDDVKIYYRQRWKENWQDPWDPWGQWTLYTEPFNKEEDSIHELEYNATDWCNNTEEPHFEIDIVDTKPPETTKEIIGPQYYDDVEDKLYIDGVTEIELTCADPEPHPVGVDNIQYRYRVCESPCEAEPTDWFVYREPFSFPEESLHELEYYCNDTLGNEEEHHFQYYYVDKTPPETTKEYGDPFYTDGISEWITSQTPITLSADDGAEGHDSGVAVTYWRNFWIQDPELSYMICGEPELYCNPKFYSEIVDPEEPWNVYEGPFYKPEESCHIIEYYSIDNVEKTEDMKWQCVYVDNTEPYIGKDISGPMHECTEDEWMYYGEPDYGCYYITQQSTIYLNCFDEGDHPVDNVTLYYRDYLMEGEIPEFTAVPGGYVEIQKEEDSEHVLEFYCEDALGNTDGTHTEIDIVDTQPPVSEKTLGDPKHECTPEEQTLYYPGMDDPTGGCYFINQSTPITLTCADLDPHPVDHVKIYYRDYLIEEEPPGFTEVDGDEVTFYKDKDSAHILEWYCVDELGNEEDLHVEYDIVDTVPPETTKNIIGPQYYDEQSDKFYIDGVTEINLTCVDPDPHPADHEIIYYRYRVNDGDWTEWFVYSGPFSFPEESKHELEYYCEDALGNTEEVQSEIDYVDHTPPVTTKTYGTPRYPDDEHNAKWITPNTPVTLTADDGESIHASGVRDTFYFDLYLSDPEDWHYCYEDCETFNVRSIAPVDPYQPDGWELYEGSFYKPEESCHIIAYYSVDNVDKVENIKWQCVFVDDTPPDLTKEIGDPKHECEPEEECDWYVTQDTEITLTCIDPHPHPVDEEVIYYRYRYRDYPEDDWSDWQEFDHQGEEVTFTFPEDSIHELEYWCVDALGNEAEKQTEIDIVDTHAPLTGKRYKTVGEPKVECEEEEDCDYYITDETNITLKCTDPKPHPVDHEEIWYRYNVNDGDFTDWMLYTEPFTFPEYCRHTLEWYCKDALNNTGSTFTEIDEVDNKPPVITPDPCYNVQSGTEVTIWAIITDDKVGVDDSTTKAYIEYPNGTVEEVMLVYNPVTDRYEAQWTPPGLEGVYYVDFAASDLLGLSTYLDDGKFIVVDNTPPAVSSVFAGRNWIGEDDKFYVDVEVDENFDEICGPVTCLVRIVDNAGKEGYLEGQLTYEHDVMKCAGFVTVNDTFYEAQAELWVDVWDAAGNFNQSRKLEPIGIDNSRMIDITGVDESAWYKGGQWIYDVVATVDSSKFGEVTSCSADISGVSPEHTLIPSGNECVGDIRVPVDISDGEKTLKITAININGKAVSDSVNIRIDNVPPEKTIFSPKNGTYYSTEIPVVVGVYDFQSGAKNATYRIVKDPFVFLGILPIPGTEYDSGWISLTYNGTTYNDTFDTDPLESGETYYFAVFVCDNLGNCVDPTISFGIDKDSPSWNGATLTVTYSPYDKDGNVTISWPVALDGLSGIDHYNVYVNEDLWVQTSETNLILVNLTDGLYSFDVIPVDSAGNEGSALTGSTTVDRTCSVDGTCTPTTTTTTISGGSRRSRGTSIATVEETTTTTLVTTTTTISPETETSIPVESEEMMEETGKETTTSQSIGITGMFLTALASLGYWWVLILVVLILLIIAANRRRLLKKSYKYKHKKS